MSTVIAITLGDPTGIGPEVALCALAQQVHLEDTRYLLIGDEALIRRLDQKLGLGLPFAAKPEPGAITLHSPDVKLPPRTRVDFLPQGSPASAQAALTWLRAGAELCLRGEADALVTGPVNKQAILRSGQAFAGQTEYLSALAGTDRTVMMLLGQDEQGRWLRVALATTHVPLKDVPACLTQAKVELAITLAAQACHDLGLPSARVGVCGLNPHAGEGGELGTEEAAMIAPAIERTRSSGLNVAGPFGADTLFYQALHGRYDVVVAMYHDQGLAPLKLVAFHTGVNWTLGLPFIRVSPDHGTAYDLAGKGLAEPSSMLSALRLARQLAQRPGASLRG